MLINFLVQTLQSTETLILDLVCPWKYEKSSSKIRYFRKIEETFITAQPVQTVKFNFSNVAYRPTEYKTGLKEVTFYPTVMTQYKKSCGIYVFYQGL